MAFQINTHDFMCNHISECLFYQIRKIKGTVHHTKIMTCETRDKHRIACKIRKYRTRHESRSLDSIDLTSFSSTFKIQ